MFQSILFVLIIATVVFLGRRLKKTPLAQLSPTQQSLIALGILVFLLLALTGRLGLLVPLFGAIVAAFAALVSRLAPLLGPYLLRGLPDWLDRWRTSPSEKDSPSAKKKGPSLMTRTSYLHMTLDRETGRMNGTVLQGTYEGRTLESLSLHALLDLYGCCLMDDDESARLVQAFIQQKHEQAFGGPEGRQKNTFNMDRQEALEILGLRDPASDDEILTRHRQLIQRIHPDRGGSDYLAARINQAKDFLLQRPRPGNT